MNLLSIFSNIEETNTLYVVIAIVVILLLWGLVKIIDKKSEKWGLYLTSLIS